MKLTRASDFAIRLLTHLASNGEDAKSGELAEELDIPFNHLSKLVQLLARRGYILTRKGKGGGLRLAMDPKKVDLAEIVEAVEGPISISDCIFNKDACRFSSKCRVRKCLGGVRNTIQKMLSRTTIHDMAV